MSRFGRFLFLSFSFDMLTLFHLSPCLTNGFIFFYFIFYLGQYQVHTLLKGLEKIAKSADIPMLVCGDFNSVPGRWCHLYSICPCSSQFTHLRHLESWIILCLTFPFVNYSAPHALLAMGKIDAHHPDLTVDPISILRPYTKYTHQLPLVWPTVTCSSTWHLFIACKSYQYMWLILSRLVHIHPLWELGLVLL